MWRTCDGVLDSASCSLSDRLCKQSIFTCCLGVLGAHVHFVLFLNCAHLPTRRKLFVCRFQVTIFMPYFAENERTQAMVKCEVLHWFQRRRSASGDLLQRHLSREAWTLEINRHCERSTATAARDRFLKPSDWSDRAIKDASWRRLVVLARKTTTNSSLMKAYY